MRKHDIGLLVQGVQKKTRNTWNVEVYVGVKIIVYTVRYNDVYFNIHFLQQKLCNFGKFSRVNKFMMVGLLIHEKIERFIKIFYLNLTHMTSN